jgi:dTDP-4-amino-4,6-dideoxygalactose transaminase
MIVPLVDLRRQYLSINSEIDAAVKNVIADSAFIGGKYQKSFETNFASYVGARHCIGVGNGTDALYIALKSLGVGEGDEVITAANSFVATSEAVTLTGARVVFVDCDKYTYNADARRVEQAVTARTRAIIPVHLYGQPADMDPIMEVAGKYGLYVVEDAAQAHGARYRGRGVGTFGHCACFSFFPGKNLGAYGDAGAVVTSDDDIAVRVRMYANHGRLDKYNHEFEGVNSRLDGMQAAILDVKLKHLEEWTERRIAAARMYDEGLSGHAVIPSSPPGARHVYHQYVVRVKGRDAVARSLAESGVATGIHYPVPLPFLKAYKYLGHKEGDFPMAFALKDEILSLPMHGGIGDDEVRYVIEQLVKAVEKGDKKWAA